MAPTKRQGKGKVASPRPRNAGPPAPFKVPAEVLQPFIEHLSTKHVYVAHIDTKPASFKRKIFSVPVLMNVAVAALFCLRMYYILPWYFKIVVAGLGRNSGTTFAVHDSTWSQVAWEISRRAFTMFFDFLMLVFVWPWPVEFVAGVTHGNPVRWRWNVGFRDKEIYVRRSRDWDAALGDVLKDDRSNRIFTAYANQATSPLLVEQKTGYLLMNGQWDLDWECMVRAHAMVDGKDIALDVFRSLVLVYHEDYGWLCYDANLGASSQEDEKRRQVFKFRDALAAMGQEKLFYRWVEIVQFEANQPGGFGPDQQEAAAKKIRDMFGDEGIDFDELWKEAVGTLPGAM